MLLLIGFSFAQVAIQNTRCNTDKTRALSAAGIRWISFEHRILGLRLPRVSLQPRFSSLNQQGPWLKLIFRKWLQITCAANEKYSPPAPRPPSPPTRVNLLYQISTRGATWSRTSPRATTKRMLTSTHSPQRPDQPQPQIQATSKPRPEFALHSRVLPPRTKALTSIANATPNGEWGCQSQLQSQLHKSLCFSSSFSFRPKA